MTMLLISAILVQAEMGSDWLSLFSNMDLPLWNLAIRGLMLLAGGMLANYFRIYLEKKLFATHNLVISEVREIRKAQKQGLITQAQADARIEKLMNPDSVTPTSNA